MVPKMLGADIELGNSFLTAKRFNKWSINAWPNQYEYGHFNGSAARLVIDACRDSMSCIRSGELAPVTSAEYYRTWLPNGGCLYIDMSHLEMCVPETINAKDHVAAFHAMLNIVYDGYRRAKQQREDLFLNVHVSDGTYETSWGAHFNILMDRNTYDSMLKRNLCSLSMLASFVAASATLFGQGLVLDDGKNCDFVLSARAHHIGEVWGLPTTIHFNRNLVNIRDESHASSGYARLHLIAFDPNLQPTALYLRSGLTQLFLAAMESGWRNGGLALLDPVAAIHGWSKCFNWINGKICDVRFEVFSNKSITLLEWHKRLHDDLKKLVDTRVITDHVVPNCKEILLQYAELLNDLSENGAESVVNRLDWALKWLLLNSTINKHGIKSAEVKYLDQVYSSVDKNEGLFWNCLNNGIVDTENLDNDRVAYFMHSGDENTRSGLRGAFVAQVNEIACNVDWGKIELWRPLGHWISLKDGVDRAVLVLPEPLINSNILLNKIADKFGSLANFSEWFAREGIGYELRIHNGTTFDKGELKPRRGYYQSSRWHTANADFFDYRGI